SSVQGTVVNALTGEGLRKATVILRSSDTVNGFSYAEEADANGRFRIDDVLPGEYSVTADRQNFFLRPDGAPGAPPPRLKIAAGEQVDGLLIKLVPAGVITGRVLDQDGDPVRGALVQVMQYVYVAGERQLRQTIQVVSKDKGDYRLFNLRAGTFFIRAMVGRNGPSWNQELVYSGHAPSEYAVTFFPSAVDAASATPIQLSAGAELRGYDITMHSETPHRIRLTLPSGDASGILPQLRPRDGTFFTNGGMSFSGDKVEFSAVVPGAYVILATRQDGAAKSYARLEVDVRDADVDAGTLEFQPPRELSGTVKIEGNPARPPPNVRFALQPDGPSLRGEASADIKPDGKFTIKDVAPGIYRTAVVTGPGNLYVKSIRVGDQALLDRRIDLTKSAVDILTVVLGADAAEVQGAVKKANGDPCVHARITLFPDGATANRPDLFKFVFSDEKGDFHFKGIAPGEYKLFAWEDVLGGQPQDPDFRKRFEKQASPLKVRSNGHEKVGLTAISVAATTRADQ
ncbi:MAG TPA: carboxypeptidase-like regulatory domain-containing protein, partial [Candidatus Binataceae bacterium]|nr:carboxypeptidase-like regulatory domain-containing protein [Candidatus Binataceae bacterium]